MLKRLLYTHKGNVVLNSIAAFIGVLLICIVGTPRAGTVVFLFVTAAESGVFSLIYGFRADWRAAPAARAVFYTVLAYFMITAHLITLYLSKKRWWWTDYLRELLYLGLVVAGLNLVLTLVRLLGRRVYRD